MNSSSDTFEQFLSDIKQVVNYFKKNHQINYSPVKIYTHLDADGLSSGAILGKALYREEIAFQMTVIKQLEREEIQNIVAQSEEFGNFIIFSDFGSGQYLALKELLKNPFIILDHHLPQKIANKEEFDALEQIYLSTKEWHINPYFYGFNGSIEVSGAGMCYYFAKVLNEENKDLSAIAMIGANGDVQNQGPNKSFTGINSKILEDAKECNLIEIVDDINFSPIRPLNEALAYSSDINLPGLSGDINKSLKFLKKLGIIMEKTDGKIKTLLDLNQSEKQKITSGIIEYASLKLDIEPYEILNNLIVNRYLLTKEEPGTDLHDINEFSNLLNACGRSNNASIGIAIAMGDREKALKQARENLKAYKKTLSEALLWVKEKDIIKELDYIQYFYGEDKISDTIIGTVCSMLIYDESKIIKKSKPIVGYAKRKGTGIYKLSARAHESIVQKGVNLSEAIRDALQQTNLNALGGGHPPAAGTTVPINKIEQFLDNMSAVIQNQLEK
ncbi:MAG: RecJ-like exonuclease [Promethearchaeota archaeon]|nr:MAG: RecJ-like exonuclease [Candidatus Lokiarchaeota archaeon]